MICPNCNKEAVIQGRVFDNIRAYGNTVLAKTECCGVGLWVTGTMTFKANICHGDQVVDSWGCDIKQVKSQ